MFGAVAAPPSGGAVEVTTTLMPAPRGGRSESTGPPLPVLSLARQPGG
jgi:hypothetical protein